MTLKGSGLVRVFFFDLTSLYHRLNRLSIEPGEKIQFVHNPVSYTHLDVYKRQLFNSFLFDQCAHLPNRFVSSVLNPWLAVSFANRALRIAVMG